MASLDQATLSAEERILLNQFLKALCERLGDELEAVWLFGSRARGEAVDELSDIDVLVLTARAGWDGSAVLHELLHKSADEVSLPDLAWAFSLHVHQPRWLRDRRAINSFFIAEIDRDHVDLTPARP